MPLPLGIGKFNRMVINPITRLIADRLPPFAMLVHRGRKSGRDRRTPVFAFPTGDGFVIALVYGRGTDWERNLFAVGEGAVVYRGRHHAVRKPRRIPVEGAEPYLPAVIRAALSVGRVTDFIRLDVVDGEDVTA